jgi:hypothetical protein
MRRLRASFTIRSLTILVALVALNLAATIVTSRYYARKPPYAVSIYGNGRGFQSEYSDGSRRYFVGSRKTGYRLTRIEPTPAAAPTLVQIWSPVLASVSITLLVWAATWQNRPWQMVRRAVGSLRTRYTDGTLMITAALAGLNVAGVIMTSRCLPRREVPTGSEIVGRTLVVREAIGLTLIYQRVPAGGLRLSQVVREPRPPTLLQIWSPVTASALITVLVVAGRSGRPAWRRARIALEHGAGAYRLASDLLSAARWATIVIALVGLNLVAAASLSGPDRSDIRMDYLDFFGVAPRIIQFRVDGSSVRRNVDASDVLPHPVNDHGADEASRGLEGATIEYRRDGSVAAYVGSARNARARPRLIRQPTRSLVEYWSPVITSASNTLLAIGLLCRRAARERGGAAAEAGAVTAEGPPGADPPSSRLL